MIIKLPLPCWALFAKHRILDQYRSVMISENRNVLACLLLLKLFFDTLKIWFRSEFGANIVYVLMQFGYFTTPSNRIRA